MHSLVCIMLHFDHMATFNAVLLFNGVVLLFRKRMICLAHSPGASCSKHG